MDPIFIYDNFRHYRPFTVILLPICFFSFCKKIAACDFNGLNGIYNTNQIGYTNIVPGNPIAPVNLSQNYQQVPNNNRLNTDNNLITAAPTYSNDNYNNKNYNF